MNDWQLRIYGEIVAAQVRCMAMVAENEARADQGKAQAYGEQAFYAEAHQIQDLVRQL